MSIQNFISVDSTLNSLIITSNIGKSKTIRLKSYLKSDNFSKDFDLILKKSSIDISQANLLLVNLGPGSYAGIRNILTCLKVLSLIKKIKIVGFTNNTLWKVVRKNNQNLAPMIISINKKFFNLGVKFRELKTNEFERILSKKKVVSNCEYNGIFKKNLVPFVYGFKDIEVLVQKKLFLDKNLKQKY